MGGDVARPANDREIAEMRRLVAESLAEGASGFSTGLWYPPNMHATTEEVIAVGEPLKAAGGMYFTHMRDEADRVCASIEETLKIGKRIGVPAWISHHKCSLPENFGRSAQTLALLEAAASMQEVAYDVYPYPAGSTVLMPDRLRDDLRVIVTWSIPHPEFAGKDLKEVARGWNTDIRSAAERLLPAGAITFQMDEEDVRLWGTFPRVLGFYSRQLGLLSLEEAIHKMTGRTASLFGMVDRGVLREGAYADLVLFDPARVIDTATFEEPKQEALGIEEVWTNGRPVFRAGHGMTGETPGRLIRRNRA